MHSLILQSYDQNPLTSCQGAPAAENKRVGTYIDPKRLQKLTLSWLTTRKEFFAKFPNELVSAIVVRWRMRGRGWKKTSALIRKNRRSRLSKSKPSRSKEVQANCYGSRGRKAHVAFTSWPYVRQVSLRRDPSAWLSVVCAVRRPVPACARSSHV